VGSPVTVSVIINFLDPLPWLAETVQSVFRQTCTDWELLLVDDGSTDGSTEFAQQLARTQPDRVRYLEHPGHANRGMSASRNLGLQHARGRYVAFLDADDVYLPERLERHVRLLDAMPGVDMVQSDLIFWHSWQPLSRRPADDHVRPFLSVGDRVLPPPVGLLTVLAAPLLSAGICNITVRRDVALELGGFEDRFRGLYEDQVFTSKVYLEKAVYVLQDYLAKYRRHPGSAVRRAKHSGELVESMGNSATREFHGWLKQYVAGKGISDPLLDEALARLDTGPAQSPWSRRLAGPVVAMAKSVLVQALPASWHRRLMQWVWRREMARTQRQYQALRARLGEAAVRARAGDGSP
jgi:glycosyltransferase involved in cell wall biosynthesis